MTSVATRQAVDRVERDRRRIEYAATTAAAKIGNVALRHAAAAIRLGHDPRQAAREVLTGNRVIGQYGLAPLLSRMLLVANLKGRRRSVLEARAHASRNFAAAEDRQLENEKKTALALLLIGDDEIDQIRQAYDGMSEKLTDQAVEPLMDRIGSLVDEHAADLRQAKREAGPDAVFVPKIPTLIRNLRGEFAKAGFIPGNAHALANVFETANVMAFEEGRRDGWDAPPIAEVLWGFRYSSILDDRTTRLCRTLDGTIAPKDDPFWDRFTPPNHWNCRSAVVEVWKSDALREPDTVQTSATADEIEQFLAIKRDFLGYF